MKRTHKKILGFTGLGIVTAMTAAAAMLPAPLASATTNVTDTIKVTVVAPTADLIATSGSGSSISVPEYNFNVAYNAIYGVKATLVNYDADGNIKKTATIWEEDLGGVAGSRDFALNLDEYGGTGFFTITIVGTASDGVQLEQILNVTYKTESEDVDPDPDSGEADVDVDVPTQEVAKVVVDVYDTDGNLVKTVEIPDPNNIESLDLSDLPDGVYETKITSYDDKGNIIEEKAISIVIDRDGGSGADTSVPVEIGDKGEPISEAHITITDENGDVIKTIIVSNPTPGDVIDVDTSDIPDGTYNIDVDYYGNDGNLIGTDKSVITKNSTDGVVDVDIDKTVDSVTTIEADIYNSNGDLVRILKADRASGTLGVYDAAGNLLFSLPNGYANGKLTIPMEGLPYGDYTGTIMYKNQYGNLVGDAKTIKIKYYGTPIIVPDTGSFFQGLNISREDYLITGLIVFMVIGVVAFGVVKKTRSDKKIRTNSRRRH